MAFLPSLQESMQSVTGGVLFLRTEHTRNKSLEEKANSGLSVTLHDSLGLNHAWESNNVLGYSPFLKSGTWETTASSSIILHEPLPYDFSAVDEAWKAGASSALTSWNSSEKERIKRETGTLIIWQSQSKIWEAFYSLVLDLQDLLVTGQIWEERNILAHVASQVETWKNWSNSTMLFHDFLEARGVLEDSKVSIIGFPTTDAQQLEQLYVFRKPTKILHFIEANRFLIPLLREAYINIRKYFLSSELFLEVITDPEAINEEQLVIFIVADQDPDEASEALNQLDEGW